MARSVLRFNSPLCIGITTRGLVVLAHINRMASALAPKRETQSFGNANQVLCSGRG
jgi:hypothetical protein